MADRQFPPTADPPLAEVTRPKFHIVAGWERLVYTEKAVPFHGTPSVIFSNCDAIAIIMRSAKLR